jgi:N-dimethylarginine dimethylaminohydrolase
MPTSALRAETSPAFTKTVRSCENGSPIFVSLKVGTYDYVRRTFPASDLRFDLYQPARFVMSRPDYFEVDYVINARMQPETWAANRAILKRLCLDEWVALAHVLLSFGARIEEIAPVEGLPDMVFSANSAVVLDGRALLARFRYDERRGEEPHYLKYYAGLKHAGLLDEVHTAGPGVILEGHGDAVWDETRGLFWYGYGPRSSYAGAREIERVFGTEVIPLELAGTRFYHLDTALAPLSGGDILYAPQAFVPAALDELQRRIPPAALIEAPAADAEALTVNLIAMGEELVVASCSNELERALRGRGYRITRTPLSTFALSGGSAFCLTLRLDKVGAPRPSVT